MDLKEARSYLNYLLTLNIRGEEAFGPMALAFIKDNDLGGIGLEPEEQFGLLMATVQSLADEPKRFSLKLEMLQKTKALLSKTRHSNTELARQIDYDLKKTKSELAIYNEAMRPTPRAGTPEVQQLIVQTDIPEYFLDIAQKRASEYYQNKFGLTKEAKTAQHFTGGPRKFEPDNKDVHREFPGACAPFMNSRTNAFHMMLPFDLKLSKKPDDPLDAGSRIFYTQFGYSFPLAYEMDKLISYQDGQALEIALDDPNLLFVSFSRVKEKDFKFQGDKPNVPPEYAYPMTVLERLGTLGTYVQIVSNFKVWFDSAQVSVLLIGAGFRAADRRAGFVRVRSAGRFRPDDTQSRVRQDSRLCRVDQGTLAGGPQLQLREYPPDAQSRQGHRLGPLQHAAVHRLPRPQPAEF